MLEFLYSSENKVYLDWMVNPYLQEVSRYLKVALAILKCESTNTLFTKKMIDLAAMILVAVGSSHFFAIFEDSWIYKIMRVSNRVRGCSQKSNKLVLMALEILTVISLQRTDQ